MAGVKAKKNAGPRKEPRFIVSPCGGCSSPISALRDAYRVKWISFDSGKRRSGMTWRHRTCVGMK
jgi:hypothetical protein